MRTQFFKTLSELAKKDERIWLLTADMLCPGSEEFPKDRMLNFGVAEQSMVGAAAGLACCGKIPFCYSISTFLIFRAYEFIRNDIAYQNLPVRLVGCYGPYPDYGISHNTEEDEDKKIISQLPNFYVVDILTPNSLPLMNTHNKPIYFRLPRG